MKHVWNYEELMKQKNEIQKSLIHHIVDDRLQEGALVTDLIDSIKSSSSIPYQLVSNPVINIVLINYCVNCFRRHNREYWRRRYLINFQRIDYISKLVDILHITSNYMGANILTIIIVIHSLEATSNGSTGTPNVTEGCWKETP